MMKQRELAEASGVSEITISRIENDRHEPTLTTIRKLAEGLGVEPEELREGGHTVTFLDRARKVAEEKGDYEKVNDDAPGDATV